MQYLEILGVLTGLAYLYYEYQAKQAMWFYSIAMALIYIVIYQHSGLYGYMGIFAIYLIMSLYGLYAWHGRRQEAGPGQARLYFMPSRFWLPLTAMAGILTGALYLLIRTGLQTQPNLLDLFIASLSIINMWMLSQRWVEQWLVLIVINTLSLLLFWTAELDYTFFLYMIYWLVSFAGYCKWHALARRRV